MIKVLHYILLLMATMLASCGQWLDVDSKSDVDEDEMYQTADGFYSSLTGLYLNMGSATLYGGALSMTALEPLTQQYTVSNNNPDRIEWTRFNYRTESGEATISSIWLTMFNTIVNANLLLEKLQTAHAEQLLSADVANTMKGEALALRALMYFDLVRLFNESPSVNPSSQNVPFKTDFGFALGNQLTTTQLLQQLVEDLQQARQWLSSDPIGNGTPTTSKYLSYNRQQRMNRYAATALLARIELYRGNYEQAAHWAEEVIESRLFRFILPEEIIQTDAYGSELMTDRIFMPEMIFALYSENILSTSRSFYEGLSQDFVKSTQAYADGDVRSAWFFRNPSANGKINLIRYQRSSRQEDQGKYADPVVPMLKLSEMHLIMAECALMAPQTGLNAASCLNVLRKARRESELSATATPEQLRREITREYICDFRGEGQLFYYYKRLNMSNIDDGNYNGNTVSVPQEAYTLPLPEYEKQFGYGQNNH